LCCLVNDGKITGKNSEAQAKKYVLQPVFITFIDIRLFAH